MAVILDEIFESFDKNKIFKNKEVLQSNYKPEDILHRDEHIKQIASILAPVLRGEKCSNLFLYGKTGTGKTLSIQYVRDEMMKRVKKDSDFSLKIEYLNCKLKKISDTDYRILAELILKLGGEKVPDTGLPTERVYNRFINVVDSEKQIVVLILDEIDQVVKKISSDFLYNLTRLNNELSQAKLCLVGISNDLTFLDEIDPRVRSSLSEEEIVFLPYNAIQLQEILRKRAAESFKEGVLQEGVIEKCAAFSAKGYGDARRALDLLRVAGELAERDNSEKITFKHIDEANKKLENDKVLEIIQSEPKPFHYVLNSIIQLTEQRIKEGKSSREPIFTGDVYNHYSDFCNKSKLEVLTQRRVSDIIQEFDMFGIINVRVVSKGRGGRMREINLVLPQEVISKVKEIIRNSIDLR